MSTDSAILPESIRNVPSSNWRNGTASKASGRCISPPQDARTGGLLHPHSLFPDRAQLAWRSISALQR